MIADNIDITPIIWISIPLNKLIKTN
jgi:hypothetical protein